MPTVRLKTRKKITLIGERVRELKAMQDDLNRELEL